MKIVVKIIMIILKGIVTTIGVLGVIGVVSSLVTACKEEKSLKGGIKSWIKKFDIASDALS